MKTFIIENVYMIYKHRITPIVLISKYFVDEKYCLFFESKRYKPSFSPRRFSLAYSLD